MDCSLPGSSVHEDSPGKNTRVGCHALHQGIFQTQGSNPGLPHYRWILSEPPGKPKNTGMGSLSLLQEILLTQPVEILSYMTDLPLGIKPGSPALQADSLPSESPGKPIACQGNVNLLLLCGNRSSSSHIYLCRHRKGIDPH